MQRFDLNCGSGSIRIVLDSQEEGILSTLDGTVELHCKQLSFEKIQKVHINDVENAADLLPCLMPSLQELFISKSFIGKFESNVFSRFINLTLFYIKNTYLANFDFSALENFNQLNFLDLSWNSLQKFDNLTVLSTLSSLTELRLGGNTVGKLNVSFFENLVNLRDLNLTCTNLSLDDFSLFDPLVNLEQFDISCNDLQNINFKKSKKFNKVRYFVANNCKIKRIRELISLFGPSLDWLDVSGNFVDEIELTTFEHLTALKWLNLAYMNLTQFNVNVLKHQKNLKHLNISNNHLKEIDFTPLKSKSLEELYLEGNDLTQVNISTEPPFTKLRQLAISRNNFSCDFLGTFVKELNLSHSKMFGINSVGDIWNQKHGIICNGSKQITNEAEDEKFDKTIGKNVTMPLGNPTTTPILGQEFTTSLWIYIAIITSILSVIITAIVCVIIQKSSKKKISISKDYDEPKVIIERGEDIEMRNLPNLPEPAPPIFSISAQEPIYEEIPDNGYTYDRLEFDPQPIPIPTNNIYHNFLLLNTKYTNKT